MELDRVPEVAKYLSLVFLFGWIGRSTVWNFLPVFFKTHIESVFLIGIITSIPPIITVLFDIPAGNLVQRAGEKIVVLMGLIAAIFPAFLYITAAPVLLLLGKVFEGFTKVLVWNGSWSLTLKQSDDDVESETVSVVLLGANLGAVLGPILGGYLIASEGFSITFYIWAFTSAVAVLVFYSYIGASAKKLRSSVEKLGHRKTYFDDWHHLRNNWKELRFAFGLTFLYSIIFSFYWLAVPLLLDKMGAGFEQMGIIFGVAALPKVFQFVFGGIADRYGKLETISVLSLVLSLTLVGVFYVQSLIAIGVLFFVARTFSSGMSPPVHAFYDSKVPDDIEGEMTGFFEMFKHLGQMLGPFLAGTIASIWSVNASFLAAAVVSLLIGGLSLVARRY
ncbi:MAG: MFS transporter [Nanohaloarchaea archaeon]|nr:MFS transporter [Candidatus Nanohaloarchaea archaeon]